METNPLLNAMDPSLTLWQFLLQLLEDRSQQHLICWTGRQGEFKLLEAEQVARLWGQRKNKSTMTYDKLSRALRYYYDKNIIKKVSGQKFVYRFVSQPDLATPDGGRPDGARPEDAPPAGLGGVASCLPPQRPPSTSQKSSRNDYMKSGLYSTFTIQSLQAPPPPRPIKAELLLQADHAPREVEPLLNPPRPTLATSPPPPAGQSQGAVCPAGDAPQIYLTGVGDAPSLTPLLPQGGPPDRGVGGPPVFVIINPPPPAQATSPPRATPPPQATPPIIVKEEHLPSEAELLEMVGLDRRQPGRGGPRGPRPGGPEPEPPLTITESPPPSQEPAATAGEAGPEEAGPEEAGKDATESAVAPDGVPPKPKKPPGLELPPGLSLDKVNAAVNSLLAPGSAANTLTPTVITSHALTPVLLTPSPLPSTIHFWSTLSPIAPRSPAKLSFQFPSNGSNQIHVPALSVDGLSTPVVLSPGPQKP